MLEQRSAQGTTRPFFVVALAVAVVATGAIVATYNQLSNTFDEPKHVAAGLELIQDGRYTFHTENPPFSRVVLALVPHLRGARLPPPSERPTGFAVDLYYRTASYVGNVTEGRLANLGFFWACIVLTWLLAGGRRDPWVSVLAVASLATLPPLVAHAGLATTDVAFVATFLVTLLALRRALARPGWQSGVLFGAALGLSIATKFSTFVFSPPAVLSVVATHYAWRRRDRIGAGAGTSVVAASPARPGRAWGRFLLVTIPVAAVVVWACYGFHVGRLGDLPGRFSVYGNMPTTGWLASIRDWRIPAHEFFHGLLFLKAHTIAGHRATLFDEFSQRGFLMFYPVVLATKTPLPFLIFAVLGLSGLARARTQKVFPWFLGLALGALGVLLVAVASPINLGVRHVLVVYPLVAIAAAYGLVRWSERLESRSRRRLVWLGAGCAAAQLLLLLESVPNQITYFNVLAGSDPAYISSDSDFDWGQDYLAMERYFKEHPVPELYVAVSGTAKVCRFHLPPIKALPAHPVSGWVAVSERIYRLNQGAINLDPCGRRALANTVMAEPGWLDWLKKHRPVATIGKTVRLYHIPATP